MTREELKLESGKLVQIRVNGKDSHGVLKVPKDSPAFIEPQQPEAGWHEIRVYILTDADVASMLRNGTVIFSLINLKKDGTEWVREFH
jgi:hypothetical protein